MRVESVTRGEGMNHHFPCKREVHALKVAMPTLLFTFVETG